MIWSFSRFLVAESVSSICLVDSLLPELLLVGLVVSFLFRLFDVLLCHSLALCDVSCQ